MIVRNEEKYLDRCLKSVQGIVDEIIVVDTGSTDQTIEIAKRYNAKVYNFEWINDFAAARNFAIQQATSDYILVLDADEYLDETTNLQCEIEEEKDYYMVKHKNYLSDNKVTYHYNIRLFKNGIGLHYRGKLHEHLNIHDPGTHFTCGTAEFLIHHVGYMPEVYVEKNKRERNMMIMEKEVEENPSAYSYYNMGKTLVSNQRYEEALEFLRKSYQMGEKYYTYTKSLFTYMIICLHSLKRYEEGLYLINEFIKVFPDYTEFYYQKGILFEELGYFKDAELLYKKCLELGDREDYSTDEGVGSYLAYYRLAELYCKQKRYADSFDAAFNSIKVNKYFRPALSLYLSSMLKTHISIEETYEHLNIVYPINNIEDIKTLMAGLYETRHPLLDRYFEAGTGHVRRDLIAVAKQYSRKYHEALREWESIDSIPIDNWYDVLLLALLLQNRELMQKCKNTFNLSDKEWKILNKIVYYQEIKNLSMTSAVEKVLIKLCNLLILLKEFEVFEYISWFVMQSSINTQLELVDILVDFGYLDTALELLTFCMEKWPKNPKVYEIIGDIYYRKKDFKNALLYYQQTLKYKKDYPIYERLYNLYEKMSDLNNLNQLKNEMITRFPLSMWIKSI
jgi:glycosyltransferase involved in cell wall biosynthesis